MHLLQVGCMGYTQLISDEEGQICRVAKTNWVSHVLRQLFMPTTIGLHVVESSGNSAVQPRFRCVLMTSPDLKFDIRNW